MNLMHLPSRRKMKCDGAHPVCDPCTRSTYTDDCEYTDSGGRSRTQILEETIIRLKERVEELEDPDSTAASVLLYDPLVALRDSSPMPCGSQSPVRLSLSCSALQLFFFLGLCRSDTHFLDSFSPKGTTRMTPNTASTIASPGELAPDMMVNLCVCSCCDIFACQ
jgi:hypothetical protein